MTYVFKDFKKFLFLETAASKIALCRVTRDAPAEEGARVGSFDNQNSRNLWTWAWTTDEKNFEVWRPSGLYLKIEDNKIISVQRRLREVHRDQISEILIGKTGPISYGLNAKLVSGKTTPILKDSYPYFDSLQVTYDGICEDEDFFPILMIGREIATRLGLNLNETIQN